MKDIPGTGGKFIIMGKYLHTNIPSCCIKNNLPDNALKKYIADREANSFHSAKIPVLLDKFGFICRL